MATLSPRQLRRISAKQTQHGKQRREILLREANDGAIRQRQLDPGTGRYRRNRQLQEVWRDHLPQGARLRTVPGRHPGLDQRAAEWSPWRNESP
ncbi:MAG: hypothetical protein ABSE20_31340 [Acetobacteraceae bacterium]